MYQGYIEQKTENIKNNINNDDSNDIDVNFILKQKSLYKQLKPVRSIIVLYSILILIDLFILQAFRLSNNNYYITFLTNEIICFYLWTKIRSVELRQDVTKIKIIFVINLLFELIIFSFGFKNRKIHSLLDLFMFWVINLTNIIFNIFCLFILKLLNKLS